MKASMDRQTGGYEVSKRRSLLALRRTGRLKCNTEPRNEVKIKASVKKSVLSSPFVTAEIYFNFVLYG